MEILKKCWLLQYYLKNANKVQKKVFFKKVRNIDSLILRSLSPVAAIIRKSVHHELFLTLSAPEWF